MPFSLKTITFNHDLSAATTSALNIRKNKDFETALPEYASSRTGLASSRAKTCLPSTVTRTPSSTPSTRRYLPAFAR